MAAKKQTPLPGPEERRYTVRWHRSRKCLTADPETTWRWSEPSQATPMTRAEADAAAARMGGIVCLDGVPVGTDAATLPKRPPTLTKKAAGESSPATVALREHMAGERWREALRLAVKLRGLGADKVVLERALEGYAKPDFCRQLTRDPAALIAAGIEVLKRRFGGKP